MCRPRLPLPLIGSLKDKKTVGTSRVLDFKLRYFGAALEPPGVEIADRR
jgi:hypothetical protein